MTTFAHSLPKASEDGIDANTQVTVLDNPTHGGASHHYLITKAKSGSTPAPVRATLNGDFALIHFQDGPIRACGVNGCTNEDLLAIVIHRLTSFQAGPFKSMYNEAALDRVKVALALLQSRTADRVRRGVEGLDKP